MSDASRKYDLQASAARIEWLSGPEKGRKLELAGSTLTLGRGDQADIQVPGEGVSRKHALLARDGDHWFIRDHQSKNGIQVNGKAATESWLQNGDIVQIGNVVFRFAAPEGEAPASAEIPADEAVGGALAGEYGERPKAPANRRRLILFGGVGVLLLAVVMMQGGSPPADTSADKPAGEAAEAAQEPDLNVRDRESAPKGATALDAAEKEMAGLDWSNASLREAEQLFRKGQREYLSKSYARAIDLFKEATLLSRDHKLAQLYLARATFAAESEAKVNMQLGVRYYRSLQYQRAMYHFTEAINLMQHRPKEKMIKDAERYIVQCRRRLQAAGIFP